MTSARRPPPAGPDPRALALLSWCRGDGTLAGTFALAGLSRLTPALAAVPDGDVHWQAEGTLRPVPGGEPQPWLHLRAQARVPLQCQRCLGPLALPLVLDRRFRFVRGEDEAARLDEDSDDDDVLALPARLDLRELVEDELILALPLVPRHEGPCPTPLPQPGADEQASSADVAAAAPDGGAERPHPFAALADWAAARRKSPPG